MRSSVMHLKSITGRQKLSSAYVMCLVGNTLPLNQLPAEPYMETMPDESQEEIILKTEVEGDSPGEERVKIEGGRIGRL